MTPCHRTLIFTLANTSYLSHWYAQLQNYSYSVTFSIAAGNTSCSTNVSASGAVQENDVVIMTCSITYRGNWALTMRWFDSDTRHNFTDGDITSRTSNTTVTSQLTVTASADLHGSQIICLTYFTQPPTSLPTSATNIPSYTYEWTSPTLIVQCKQNVVSSISSQGWARYVFILLIHSLIKHLFYLNGCMSYYSVSKRQ